MDDEISRSSIPSANTEAALEELGALYWAERSEEPAIVPPSRRALERLVQVVKTSPL